MGVVNAINTDGGGSATLVINDTVVSQPSDYRLVTESAIVLNVVKSYMWCERGRNSRAAVKDSNLQILYRSTLRYTTRLRRNKLFEGVFDLLAFKASFLWR